MTPEVLAVMAAAEASGARAVEQMRASQAAYDEAAALTEHAGRALDLAIAAGMSFRFPRPIILAA